MGNKVIGTTSVKLGIYEISNDSQLAGMLGDVKEMEDGRKFRLCKNGTDTLTPGLFIQGPVENAYDESVVLAEDVAVGDTTITIDVHASRGTDLTANVLKDGYIQVEDTAAAVIGHMRKIKSNPAATVATECVITVYDAFTDTATAGTDTLNILLNPYNGVMENNSTTDGPLLGVAPCDVTAAYYFWLQVAGPASGISGENTIVVGNDLAVDALAGTLRIANSTEAERVGVAMQSQDTSGNAVIFWLNLGG